MFEAGKSRLFAGILLVALLVVAGCGGGETTSTQPPPPPPAVAVATVAVSPDSIALFPNQTVTANAVVKDAAGNPLQGRTVTWSISDTALAEISPSGSSALIKARKVGSVSITAASEGHSATSRLTVRAVPVASVAVTPTSAAVISGRTAQLSAVARDSAGGTLTGRSAQWTSANSSVATVSSSGLVTGVGAGTTTITVSIEGKTANAPVTVTSSQSSGTWGMTTESVGTYWISPSATLNFIPFAVAGDFNHDGLTDFVMTSWTLSTNSADWSSTNVNPAAPVKIFLQRATGGFEDATARLLGSELNAFAQLPLIADVNRDGIDDIVLPGFTDLPPIAAPGIALISSGDHFVKRDLPKMWVHGAALFDADQDGCIDLVTPDLSAGFLRGDCAGGFESRPWAPDGAGWPTGMHACLADFNGDGKIDLLIPDAYTGNPRPLDDLVIYEMDWTAAKPKASAIHRLPMPIWDRGNTDVSKMRSHDQRCLVGDLNADGRPDVIVSSTPWALDGVDWKEQSNIQVYLNRGSWTFEDISDRAFPGRTQLTQSSLSLFLRDINGDGKLDLVYPAETYVNAQGANQVWYGVGDGTFTAAPGIDFAAMLASAKAAVRSRRGGSVADQTIRQVIPLPRADGRFDFVIPVSWNDSQARFGLDLEFAKVGWVFR